MKLQAHMLAETLQFDSEGFVTMIRGGLTSVTFAGFPALIHFGIFTRLWLTQDEAAGLVEMTTRITFNDREAANTRQPINVNRTDPSRIFVNIVNNLQMVVDRVGLIQIEAHVAGSVLPLLELPVETLGPSRS